MAILTLDTLGLILMVHCMWCSRGRGSINEVVRPCTALLLISCQKAACCLSSSLGGSGGMPPRNILHVFILQSETSLVLVMGLFEMVVKAKSL